MEFRVSVVYIPNRRKERKQTEGKLFVLQKKKVAQFSYYYVRIPKRLPLLSPASYIPRGHKYFIKIKLSREKKSTH